jgi:AcrR family transcriptional regulator
LLAAAAKLFYAEGIHAVGVDRVVSEAGVAKTTLYAHFASKEVLVAAYLQDSSDAWFTALEPHLKNAAGGGPVAHLLAIFDHLLVATTQPGFRGCPFINASAEYPHEPLVSEVVRRHRGRLRSTFRHYLTAAGATDVDSLAEALIGVWEGALVGGQIGDQGAAQAACRTVQVLLATARR